MKILIILSCICAIPLFFLGVVMPITGLKGIPNLNEGVFIGYIIVFATCLSIVMGTILSMSKYADKISNLEKYEKELFDKGQRLDSLIQKYNNLIISQTNQHS